jgi:hypothetical protein
LKTIPNPPKKANENKPAFPPQMKSAMKKIKMGRPNFGMVNNNWVRLKALVLENVLALTLSFIGTLLKAPE